MAGLGLFGRSVHGATFAVTSPAHIVCTPSSLFGMVRAALGAALPSGVAVLAESGRHWPDNLKLCRQPTPEAARGVSKSSLQSLRAIPTTSWCHSSTASGSRRKCRCANGRSAQAPLTPAILKSPQAKYSGATSESQGSPKADCTHVSMLLLVVACLRTDSSQTV